MPTSFQGLPFLLDMLAQQAPPTEAPEVLPEVQLPQKWSDFEQELNKYKKEYNSLRITIYKKNMALNKKSRDINEIQKLIDNSIDTELKTRLVSLLEDYDQTANLEKKKEEILQMKAKLLAMEKVLKDTNSIEHEKFKCFVCMDKYVDTFLDPCGHVLCASCFTRANSLSCPGCRAQVQSARKIFIL